MEGSMGSDGGGSFLVLFPLFRVVYKQRHIDLFPDAECSCCLFNPSLILNTHIHTHAHSTLSNIQTTPSIPRSVICYGLCYGLTTLRYACECGRRLCCAFPSLSLRCLPLSCRRRAALEPVFGASARVETCWR